MLGLLEKAREFLRSRTSRSEGSEATTLIQELRAEVARVSAESRRDRTEFEAEMVRLKAEHAAEVAALKAAHVAEVAQLKAEIERLQKQLYGRRSEKLPNDEGDEEAKEGREGKRRQNGRRGHGRRPISPTLEVVSTPLEYQEDQRRCPCCGDVMEPFGDDEVTDQIAFRTVAFYVKRTVRKKYSCRRCKNGVLTPPLPLMPIPKGRPDTSLLAFIATSKCADHLPLYRIQRIMARNGVVVSRSTLGEWFAVTSDHVAPIVEVMAKRMQRRHVVGLDTTGVRVQDPAHPEHIRNGNMWTYRGDKGEVVIRHAATKSGDVPAAFLKGYNGIVQADAARAHDQLFESGDILEAGCWAHTRRYFFNARATSPNESRYVLRKIRQLYRIEAEAKAMKLSFDARRALRQKKSKPLVNALFNYINRRYAQFPEGGDIYKAATYLLNQEKALRLFLEDGRVEIDNTNVERAQRAQAVGRKNWLFCGSEGAGEKLAVLQSLTVSCQELGIDSYHYLADVLGRLLRGESPDRLTPRVWAAARARAERAARNRRDTEPPPDTS